VKVAVKLKKCVFGRVAKMQFIVKDVFQPARVPEEGFMNANTGTLSPMLGAGVTAGASTSATPVQHHHHHGQKLVKEKLSESLKSCNEILKELFSKKHSVSIKMCISKMGIYDRHHYYSRDTHGRFINRLMQSYLVSMITSIS
jgi:hypothetical protein